MVEGKIAKYFEKMEEARVHCYLCPHNCVISPDGIGACRVRKNIDGDLYSLNYGKVTSMALDPVEKKPLKRFFPGSMILSVGTFGCNLKCSFCQNWTIAQNGTDNIADTFDVKPAFLVEKAVELAERDNIGLAYTYNEPSIWYEFVYDCSVLAKERGLKNVLVTNGFVGRQPLLDLLPYIDAMNIDVKAFTEAFYSKICKAALDNVKQTVETAAEYCHVEVTTLIIPEKNDSIEEIGNLSKWLAAISPEIPLHLSRFFPNYLMKDVPPTPLETLIKARDKASERLKFVFLGNV